MTGPAAATARDRVKAEAVAHCGHVWPLILAGKHDPGKIYEADAYLGGVLETSGQDMHDAVISMIGQAAGIGLSRLRVFRRPRRTPRSNFARC